MSFGQVKAMPSTAKTVLTVLGWLSISLALVCIWLFLSFGFGFGGGPLAVAGLIWSSLTLALGELFISMLAVSVLATGPRKKRMWAASAIVLALALVVLVVGFLWWLRQ
jgi:hypothetical protein